MLVSSRHLSKILFWFVEDSRVQKVDQKYVHFVLRRKTKTVFPTSSWSGNLLSYFCAKHDYNYGISKLNFGQVVEKTDFPD